MIKKFITGLAAFSALAVAMPASATVYALSMNDGSNVTINTDTMIGTWIGGAINATFSGAGLANFSIPGGQLVLPSFGTDISITPTSTITGGGGTYYPNQSHQQMFKTGAVAGGATNVMLWSYWGPAGCATCTNVGDYIYQAVGVRSYSTGSNPVPEPGMVGLMSLGVLGLAFARRRRTKVTLNMMPAAA